LAAIEAAPAHKIFVADDYAGRSSAGCTQRIGLCQRTWRRDPSAFFAADLRGRGIGADLLRAAEPWRARARRYLARAAPRRRDGAPFL